MPLFGKEPKDNVKEIVRDLLKGRNITASEQDIFLRTRFPEIARIAAAELSDLHRDDSIRYEGPKFIPFVVSQIQGYAPDFFGDVFHDTGISCKKFAFTTEFEDMDI